MKQQIFYLGIFMCLFNLGTIQAQRLMLSPEKPLPGEIISVKYNPEGTPLHGVDMFDATAFLFGGDDKPPTAIELSLKKDGNAWVGQFSTQASTKAVLFSFKNEEEEKVDNNDESGFKVLMYQPNRTAPVQGALAAKAKMYSFWAFLGDIKRNGEKELELWKREFSEFPASKEQKDYFAAYASLAKRQNDEVAIAEVTAKAEKIASAKKATEDELLFASTLYVHLKMEDKTEKIKTEAIKKFPNGKFAMQQRYTDFRNEKDIAKKLDIFGKFKKQFGNAENGANMVGNMADDLAGYYAAKEDWDNFEKYNDMLTDKAMRAGNLNNTAWSMSGESIEAEGKNLPKALAFSAKSLQLVQEIKESGEGKPSYHTSKTWKNNLGYSYAMYSDTYALLAFKNGNAEEALKYQQIAVDKYKYSDGEMVQRYVVYLEKVKGAKEAETFAAKMIADGKANSALKEQHKRLFLANNTLENAYEKYMVSLEKEAQAAMKEELKKKMIEEKAPDFRLVNMNGEEVSLESLRGKVVVIDFWATWCGPCKASFPGMQRAVNKYEKSDDVAFVFIDTWENGEPDAKKANVKKFIDSKAYTFNVLFDLDDKVVASYGVSGIPTKFVVDKNGLIRFKSVGFGGNDDELVKELSLMIEMAGGHAPAGLTGAP